MDTKTLEYMGTRVDRARRLMKDIAALSTHINALETGNMEGVFFGSYHQGSVKLGKYYDSYLTVSVVPEIKAAAIKALTTHRDQLQKELEEI